MAALPPLSERLYCQYYTEAHSPKILFSLRFVPAKNGRIGLQSSCENVPIIKIGKFQKVRIETWNLTPSIAERFEFDKSQLLGLILLQSGPTRQQLCLNPQQLKDTVRWSAYDVALERPEL